jgi:hypothetical protein
MWQQEEPKTNEQQQGKAITLALTFDLLNEMNTPGFMHNILCTLLLDKYQVRHTYKQCKHEEINMNRNTI